MDAILDYMSQSGSQGEVAQLITQGKLEAGAMRPWVDPATGKSYITVFSGGDAKNPDNYKNVPIQANATLRPYEWKQLDEVLVPIAEKRLNGVRDLIDNGLVYNLGNAMGTTVLEWHDVSDALEAVLTMDGVTRGENDRPVFTANYLPIPIIHADYEINARALAASRSLGNPLDTTMAERAARKVSDRLEKMLFTSESYTFGGGTIYSYLSYPHTNKVTLAKAWDASDVTGSEIVDDVVTMKQASIEAFHFGPWMLYIPVGFETKLDKDYTDYRGGTIRERILQIAGIKGIKVIDTLTADNVLLVQMTSDVVRLVQGMPIQNVQWEVEGKFLSKFKVLTIAVPQIRSDQDGHCGISHGTFAST